MAEPQLILANAHHVPVPQRPLGDPPIADEQPVAALFVHDPPTRRHTRSIPYQPAMPPRNLRPLEPDRLALLAPDADVRRAAEKDALPNSARPGHHFQERIEIPIPTTRRKTHHPPAIPAADRPGARV